MLSIDKNLGSREAALEFNNRVYDCLRDFGGCVDSLACENCFHVISDSTCLCGGFSECPNCHYKVIPRQNIEEKISNYTLEEANFLNGWGNRI